jgi:anti-sigma factor RsiW
MTDDGDRHFASDEELLSLYVLGRLDESERERLDRHAAMCSTCMEALRAEMRIAAGARRLGRENVKAELRQRIAAERERVRWPRVLSAAVGRDI